MTSLRARKKRATAQNLAQAAFTLAAQQGFESVTTDEISASAGVSRRTFANYYPNKHMAVVDGFLQALGVPPRLRQETISSAELPATFEQLISQTQAFLTEMFTNGHHIEHIRTFASMVDQDPSLEPYFHAVMLEFRDSPTHEFLVARFGKVKVVAFFGAAFGALGGVIQAVLGPFPMRRHLEPGQEPQKDTARPPLPSAEDVAALRDHFDQAFSYLRHGFADQ